LRIVIGDAPAADQTAGMNRHFPIPRRAALLLALPLTLVLTVSGCGRTPADSQEQDMQLLEIAERGDVSALDALLRRHADADVRDSCHWTPLMKAALNGHRDAVRHLLDAGAAVDAEDKGGYTALMLAASNNHPEVVEMLLDHGAMIDAQERTQGFTALIWAAQRGHLDTVALLLRHGADVTLPDFEGKTAADRALEEGRTEVHQLLTAPPASGASG
jgi:ankyrin repeat protein